MLFPMQVEFLGVSLIIPVPILPWAGLLMASKCCFHRLATVRPRGSCDSLPSHQTEVSRLRSRCRWAVKLLIRLMDLVLLICHYRGNRFPASHSIKPGRDTAAALLHQSG